MVCWWLVDGVLMVEHNHGLMMMLEMLEHLELSAFACFSDFEFIALQIGSFIAGRLDCFQGIRQIPLLLIPNMLATFQPVRVRSSNF